MSITEATKQIEAKKPAALRQLLETLQQELSVACSSMEPRPEEAEVELTVNAEGHVAIYGDMQLHKVKILVPLTYGDPVTLGAAKLLDVLQQPQPDETPAPTPTPKRGGRPSLAEQAAKLSK